MLRIKSDIEQQLLRVKTDLNSTRKDFYTPRENTSKQP